jgi:hypothetical protein
MPCLRNIGLIMKLKYRKTIEWKANKNNKKNKNKCLQLFKRDRLVFNKAFQT